MSKSKLAELTLEELEKKKKTIIGAAIGLGIVTFIAFSTLLYLVIKNKNTALVGVMPACFIIFLPIIIGLNQINTEIKSRKTS